ncbi:MAG TPA: HEAT repeat domain-containing protein [Anaerolineaceae bacterium]
MSTSPELQSTLTLLHDPRNWRKACQTIVKLGDRNALIPLIKAYEQRWEGSRQPLLKAMSALNAAATAPNLFDEASNPEIQRLAVHLMEIFPSEQALPRLALAARSVEPALRAQAGRSMVCQPQTPAWEQEMISLLKSPDECLRGWVIEGLSLCDRASARQALLSHLLEETNPILHDKLAALDLQ